MSLHSRAARRGASPPSKDLTKATAPIETEYKPWLHSAQNAGISKRKKVKQLTRQQKQRQQKGLELAERNLAKLEKKVKDSKLRGKKTTLRSKAWDEINGEQGVLGKENKFAAISSDVEATVELDNEMKEAEGSGSGPEEVLPIRTTDIVVIEQQLPAAKTTDAGEDDLNIDAWKSKWVD